MHWRRLVEVGVDFFADHGVVRGRLRDRVRLAGHDEPAVHRRADAAGRPRRALPRPSSRSASTARCGATPGCRDAVAAAAAVVVSELIAVSFMVLTQDMRDFSRSFFIVDALICMVAIVGSRLAERTIVIGSRTVRDRTARRTLIVGAGRTGRSLMRELRETAGERVVGFVDDNPRLRRRSVHGVKVVGTTHEMPANPREHAARHRARDDPGRPTRGPRRRGRRRAPGRRDLPLRSPRARSRPARRVRRRVRMTSA